MSGRNEKQFQSEIRQSLRMLPKVKFYFKIGDHGFQNPFDAFLIYNGIAIALEYKISKNTVSIPINDLFSNREHEIKALQRFKDAGGHSYILLNIFEAHKRNNVYIIDVDDYIKLTEDIKPAKSIKLNDQRLTKFPLMEKIKYGFDNLWDIQKITGEIKL